MRGWRQLDRTQLAEQGKVVRDNPDRGDKAVGDGEDVNRAHLDVTLSRRHRAQRRQVRPVCRPRMMNAMTIRPGVSTVSRMSMPSRSKACCSDRARSTSSVMV